MTRFDCRCLESPIRTVYCGRTDIIDRLFAVHWTLVQVPVPRLRKSSRKVKVVLVSLRMVQGSVAPDCLVSMYLPSWTSQVLKSLFILPSAFNTINSPLYFHLPTSCFLMAASSARALVTKVNNSKVFRKVFIPKPFSIISRLILAGPLKSVKTLGFKSE